MVQPAVGGRWLRGLDGSRRLNRKILAGIMKTNHRVCDGHEDFDKMKEHSMRKGSLETRTYLILTRVFPNNRGFLSKKPIQKIP